MAFTDKSFIRTGVARFAVAPIGRAVLCAGRLAAIWIALVLSVRAADVPSPIRFRDRTPGSGVDFVHRTGGSDRKFVVEEVTAGLALFDYDNDGKVDLYFLNGRPLSGTKLGERPRNHLYRNLGDFKFADVTEKAGMDGGDGYGMGVCVGDYDNDGFQDVFVSNYGENALYHNNGDGTFTDVTESAHVKRGKRVGGSACFLDYDNDGRLDLLAVNYVKFSQDKPVVITIKGHRAYPGPRDYDPDTSCLFHNEAHGVFSDVSTSSGVAAIAAPGMGSVAADYDDDGYPDIFIANDGAANTLFHNNRDGTFKNVSLRAGVALDINGAAHSNMGVDAADYDNSGRLSYFVTAFHREMATLYRNRGNGLFEDATLLSGAGAPTSPYVTWGCGFVDFDNDGHKDLFVVSGHVDEQVADYDDTTTYLCPNIVMRGLGNGKFANVTSECGEALKVKKTARGVAFADLDNDGRMDVVILNSNDRPTILRNETVTGNHWIEISLRGVQSNRDGVGARVYVVAGELSQMDEVHSGRGYQSHWGARLHFGLAKNERIQRIEVHWPKSGIVDVLENVPADRIMTIAEGSSPAKDKPLFVYPKSAGKR